MNMEERLQAVVSQAQTDGAKWHSIIHGLDTETVATENGNVPTVAKQMKDVHEEVVSGVIDYMTACETAKDITLQAKIDTLTIKNETETIKAQTLTLRNEAENFKNLSQTTFNSVAEAVSSGVSTLQSESQTQVGILQTAVASEVARAEIAANTAEQATSSKLNIDCSNINLFQLLSSIGITSNSDSSVLKFPVKMPNDTIRTIIIQFGKIVVGGDSQTAFNFPEAFPTAVISTQATFYYGFNNGSDSGCGVHSISLTGAIAQNGCNWTLGIGWVAIGY